MGIEEKLPSGVLLTTVEGVAGYMRKASFWPATFGLACCAIEMMTSGGPKYDLARFGMEVFRASPRQADLMIVAGRVSQKMAPVLRQIYDQMPDPKCVLAMGVCASSGGMFNNYAVVQGVDHVVPVDMYLPGCPPRPEMLIDAILKLHDQVQHAKLGSNRRAEIEEQETAALAALPTSDMRGPPAMTDDKHEGQATHGATEPGAEVLPGGSTREDAVGVRRGMFGAMGSGDTSGYGGMVAPIVYPGTAQRPFGGWHDEVADALAERLQASDLEQAVERVVIHRGEITFHVRREDLPVVAQMLRDDERLRFELCSGVSGVHYPDDTGRELHAVYHLLSMTHNRRIRVEVSAPDADPHIPSIVSVYPTNDWHERETYDMFGIVFDGHPALTRILMPDDWPGHPQRKDYPLGGIPVEYKGGTIPPPDERRSYN